jgi:hypothetical protein
MRSPVGSSFLALLLWALPLPAMSQGEAAIPFLVISPSPEANGMAGTSVAVKRADPLGAVFSPAQVGLAAFSTGVTGSFYPAKTDWFPPFALPDLTFNAWAIQGGVLVNDFIDVPVRLSFGLAYHRVDLKLGKFATVSSEGPAVVSYYDSYEQANGITVGVGCEFLVRAAFGYTFRSVISHLSPIGTEMEQGPAEADVSAKDYSGYIMLPIVQIVEETTGGSSELYGRLHPFADLSVGFAMNNLGDRVVYSDVSQNDPLPRTAREGVGVAGGLRLQGWEVAGATWSREGEDLLVVRTPSGAWEYQSGFGDLAFGHNVLAGHSSENVGLRAGWEIRLMEFFTYREGALRQASQRYETRGITIRLAGLLKGLAFAAGGDAPAWLLFARDHVDLQYHQAAYTWPGSVVGGTDFKSLSLSLKATPL